MGGDWKAQKGEALSGPSLAPLTSPRALCSQDPHYDPQVNASQHSGALSPSPKPSLASSWCHRYRVREPDKAGWQAHPRPLSLHQGSTSRITAQIWRTHRMMASGTPDTVTARSVELGSRSPATCTWAPVVCKQRTGTTSGYPQNPGQGCPGFELPRGQDAVSLGKGWTP